MADEAGLPKATINKLLAETLPSDLKLSAEVRDLFTDCCTEFVNLLSSEAAEHCEKSVKKSTINPEHVLSAMESLGFSAYSAEVSAAVESWKAEDKGAGARRARLKGKDTGMSEEEAIAAQQQLFAASAARCYGGAPPAAPPPAPAP